MNGNRSRGLTTRNDIARDIIAGFAAVTPTLTGAWRLVDTALADLPAILADLARTQADLACTQADLGWVHADLGRTRVDLARVHAGLGRVQTELAAVRLDRANLLAAIRACLGADADGEPDPLGYLRDELACADGPAGTRRRT